MDYTELFKLCGFETEEIEKERPRIDKAFQRFGIGEEDVRRAEGRIQEYYAVELRGVRKLLGVWMKELVALALAREENRKVIYSEWPAAGVALLMAGRHAVKDVYFGTPVVHVFTLVLGAIFDKLRPILQAGEEMGLPPGSAHCALWQMHIPAIAKGLIPTPDLIVSSGWVCDQGPEADQLLHELYGIPVVYTDGCLDCQWDEYPEVNTRQVKYLTTNVRKVRRRLEEVIGCEISDEALAASVQEVGTGYANLQTLVWLMGADPQPISQTHLDLIYAAILNPLQNRKEVNEALLTLCEEVNQRVEQGKGIGPKGAPRIYFASKSFVDPSITKMVEGMGLSVPVTLLDWLAPQKFEPGQYTETLEMLMAFAYHIAPVCSSQSNIQYTVECCKNSNVDGAIIVYPTSCRPYAINPLMIKKVIKEELGIPAMVLEFGTYDTREYSAGMLRTRIETFADLLKMSKAAKTA